MGFITTTTYDQTFKKVNIELFKEVWTWIKKSQFIFVVKKLKEVSQLTSSHSFWLYDVLQLIHGWSTLPVCSMIHSCTPEELCYKVKRLCYKVKKYYKKRWIIVQTKQIGSWMTRVPSNHWSAKLQTYISRKHPQLMNVNCCEYRHGQKILVLGAGIQTSTNNQ